ncbi:hypothetical protein N234_32600 [Ralstonia pickettii DTP0602]|nr:hypothetical protein N234_32600 [Ralstonia pickettii DTP0602]
MRHRRQRRQQRQRLEGCGARGARQRGFVHAADGHAVGEEQRVEARGLGALRERHVVRQVTAGVGLRAGMAPAGDVMPGDLDKGAEMQLARRLVL